MRKEGWLDRAVSDPSWIGRLPRSDQWFLVIFFLPIWAPFALFLATFSPVIDLISLQFDRLTRENLKDQFQLWLISLAGTALFYGPILLFNLCWECL